jgi:RimJ/RimL family protein N-acetyltransferase
MSILKGEKVFLRSLKPGDFEKVLEWGKQSDESFFLLNFPPLFNRDDLAAETIKKESEVLIISSDQESEPLGLVKIGPLRLPEKQTQIRFTINTYKKYSASQILKAIRFVLNHIFIEMNVHKVQAYSLAYEKEYETILQKLGFVKEGAYNEHFLHKNKYHSVNIFGLFKKDYQA